MPEEKATVPKEVFFKVPLGLWNGIKAYIANSSSDWKVVDIQGLSNAIMGVEPIKDPPPDDKPPHQP